MSDSEAMDKAEMLTLVAAFREHGTVTVVPARVLMLFQVIDGALEHQKRINNTERTAIRQAAFREAAEIARETARILRTNMDAFDPSAANQCDVLADLIEAAAKGGQK